MKRGSLHVSILSDDEPAKHQRRELIGKDRWHIAECTKCLGPICLYSRVYKGSATAVSQLIPTGFVVDESVPDQAARFIRQAYETTGSPDASVVMSASAVDAMLRHHGLREGTLFHRIGEAVKQGIITEMMSNWVHLVRLEANKPRHADEAVQPAPVEDARRSFEFAKAWAEILYVLPSRMPEAEYREDC